MNIGFIADIHAQAQALEDALLRLEDAGAEQIFCAGDLAGYFDELDACIRLLQRHRVRSVLGNHDLEFLSRHPDSAAARWLAALPRSLSLDLDGRRILLVHGAPPQDTDRGIRLLDADGHWIKGEVTAWHERLAEVETDLLVVGHSHQVYRRRFGSLLLLNPGSTVFNHSAALVETEQLTVRFLPLEQRAILPSWNFSHAFADRRPRSPES